MKNTKTGIPKEKTDLILNKRRLLKLVKALDAATKKEEFNYSDRINQGNKLPSYMVGSTLFD